MIQLLIINMTKCMSLCASSGITRVGTAQMVHLEE